LSPRRRELEILTRFRSRYQFHPPKYDRGPLHPVQSPPRSDPTARNFMAGPFYYPRLKQTWEHTISSDLLTLTYLHTPPGTPKKETAERLRKWVGDSPYFENRQLRGPRGGPNLRLLEEPISPNNIPEIRAVHMSMFYKNGKVDSDKLHIARSVMQAISGRPARLTHIKNHVAAWGTKFGLQTGCRITIYGDQAFEFVDKLVTLVLPKIKDWAGLKGMSPRLVLRRRLF
jgi:large subunit ribosomal protein L5